MAFICHFILPQPLSLCPVTHNFSRPFRHPLNLCLLFLPLLLCHPINPALKVAVFALQLSILPLQDLNSRHQILYYILHLRRSSLHLF
ncbi:hypothetical protein F5879DRAFT_143023 [Lentinula edodes]|nr:hypothetical protein F5879DRAFT_143023 [Lentinula edodes]